MYYRSSQYHSLIQLAKLHEDMPANEKVEQVVRSCACVARIGMYGITSGSTPRLNYSPVPTRDTSFQHLRFLLPFVGGNVSNRNTNRDAFVRAVSARLLVRRKADQLTEEEAVELGNPLRKLKSLFPNTPLKKHVPLDIFLTPPSQGQQRCCTSVYLV